MATQDRKIYHQNYKSNYKKKLTIFFKVTLLETVNCPLLAKFLVLKVITILQQEVVTGYKI